MSSVLLHHEECVSDVIIPLRYEVQILIIYMRDFFFYSCYMIWEVIWESFVEFQYHLEEFG